ncbi:MAG: hypothetical protein M3068_06260 [Gemmatimonadota bacterium]|nr:hypothetical protein [Gemmatimonadota bacterium]
MRDHATSPVPDDSIERAESAIAEARTPITLEREVYHLAGRARADNVPAERMLEVLDEAVGRSPLGVFYRDPGSPRYRSLTVLALDAYHRA